MKKVKRILSTILAFSILTASVSAHIVSYAQSEYSISSGETLDLTVDGEGAEVAFTPTVTGVYTFGTIGEFDTIGGIFFGEELLSVNDDVDEEAGDYNFCFNCYCTAGEEYTVVVAACDEDEGDTTLYVSLSAEVTEVTFEQVVPYEHIEKTEPEFWFNEGDKLTFYFSDTESAEYVYSEDEYEFIDENEDSITDFTGCEPMIFADFDDDGNYLGSATVYFSTLTFEAEAITVENPIDDISLSLLNPLVIVFETHGDMYQFSKKDVAFYYDMPDIFNDGDILTVFYKDGRTVKYTCDIRTEYDEDWEMDLDFIYFLDKDGNELDTNYLDYYEKQDEVHWTLGTNVMYVSYMGVETEIPVEIINAGWYDDSSKHYYYDENGDMATGLTSISNKSYYFDEKGIMQTGFKTISGKKYYFGADGAAYTYRKKIGNNYYYFNGAGVLQTGWIKGSTWMYGDKTTGALKTGWFKDGGKWYWFKSDGSMVTGWQKLGGKWYWFKSDGSMVTGWQKISGKWYYFNSSGAMQTGWQKLSGKWYYFNSSGAMQTGWQKLGGKWYYFESSGAMRTANLKQGKKTYKFNSSGVCLNP